jgi:ribonuclease HII
MMQQNDLFPDHDRANDQAIAGVDEAGRGPLAGPVVVAAAMLDPLRPIDGLNDSKALSEKRRLALAEIIKQQALAYVVVFVDVEEIDRINILQATMVGMQRAVDGLSIPAEQVLVDGNRCPKLSVPTQAIVGGDARVAAISAASILAKTARDQHMCELAEQYPGYGFERHKGYGTAQHMQALQTLGATPQHRRSFAPVAAVINREQRA